MKKKSLLYWQRSGSLAIGACCRTFAGMDRQTEPAQQYHLRFKELNEQLKTLRKRKSVFGMLRFGTLLAVIAIFYFLWSAGLQFLVPALLLVLAGFIFLVNRDLKNRAAIRHLAFLIRINVQEIAALNGDISAFGDGSNLAPKDHHYAADLDIFGKSSLFQFVNRTRSEPGAATLGTWLLEPATAAVIRSRQEAVKELSPNLQWRQEFQAFGAENSLTQATVARLGTWLHEPPVFMQFRHWGWLRYLLPTISSGIFVLALAGILPMSFMYATLLIFAVIAYQLNRIISPLHERLSKMVEELRTLAQTINLIETATFQAAWLKELQEHFTAPGSRASVSVQRLKKILDRLDLRYNMVLSAPLNLLLLWNLQQVLDLEKWKAKHAPDVEHWLNALAQVEAVNSLAAIHFNNPGWCMPELKEKHFSIEAESLGHPLIHADKRVDNFINIENRGEIMIVTGSNMAGKSTYLRSVGVNVVLAMAGSAVCATRFSVSPVQLLSSMRITDNLEESTSTFYAELKKLKMIIDKVNKGEKVFTLLDEILRGTNSLDRHTGSVALIRQFIRHKSAAVIATHDLTLADIRKEFPGKILNYHFDAQIEGEELYFDYKLKPGISQSLNASILMKKIGIEL